MSRFARSALLFLAAAVIAAASWIAFSPRRADQRARIGAQHQTARGMAEDPGTETITLELTEQFPVAGCYYGRSDARSTETFQVEDKRDYEIVLRMVDGLAADAGH